MIEKKKEFGVGLAGFVLVREYSKKRRLEMAISDDRAAICET